MMLQHGGSLTPGQCMTHLGRPTMLLASFTISPRKISPEESLTPPGEPLTPPEAAMMPAALYGGANVPSQNTASMGAPATTTAP